MATLGYFKDLKSFREQNKLPVRTVVESAFYGNNVVKVDDVRTAYRLAQASPGTVELTGMPIYRPVDLGLPENSNVLLFNDGAIVGRTAAARRIAGWPGVDVKDICTTVCEAIHNARFRKFYAADAVIGLESDFMTKAHLMVPEGFENNLLSWMLNFQYINDAYRDMYANSRQLPHDSDIYVYADPYWSDPKYPLGLAFFSPEQNCAAILGLRYFGEFKKGTLTLAWGIAARNGYASCHGGLKRFTRKDGSNKQYVLAVFGLSGSGKSTITHAKHNGKYDIMVLHDDAFIINVAKKYAIALEPAYFDKMADYPIGSPDNKYLLTLQNCGVTNTEDGKLIAVSEDVRCGNGRAVKSRYWSPNRVDRIDEPLNAICWLMKDPTLPPLVKVTGSALASVMGATLATRRTSAEHLAPGVDPNALVIESYANPFRTYPLAMDYTRFKTLFDSGVDCYILNTGSFMDHKVPKELTLSLIEQIVDGTAKFESLGGAAGLETLKVEGFNPDFSDEKFKKFFIERIKDRMAFVKSRETDRGGVDKLPADAGEALQKVIDSLN